MGYRPTNKRTNKNTNKSTVLVFNRHADQHEDEDFLNQGFRHVVQTD